MSAFRPVRLALAAAFALLAGAFVWSAATRRLDFDECLALRAGWLLAGDVRAEPPFAMPATLLLGALGRSLESPALVFLVARLAVVASVGTAALCALRLAAVTAEESLVAGCLVLLNATAFVHGLEFRYDAAILAALLVAWGLVVRARPADALLLGGAIAGLAAHGVKGAFFGAGVYVLALARIGADRGRLVRLHVGAAAGLATWAAIAGALGAGRAVLDTYAFWTRVGRIAGRDAGALRLALRGDAGFWLLAGCAALWLLTGPARSRGGWREDRTFWAAAFAALGLALVLLHPHPWPYQLAVVAPFAALGMATAATKLASRSRSALLAAVAAGVLVQSLFSESDVRWAVARSLSSPRAAQERALDVLRTLARPEDRVLDPSGFAYFLSPCTEPWYVDGLLRSEVRAGRWMSAVSAGSLAPCTWVIETKRLRLLPEGVVAAVESGYRAVPGGLALRRDDPRLPPLEDLARAGPHERFARFAVTSF